MKMKIHDNIGTMKMYLLVQYYDVTTNSSYNTPNAISSRKIIPILMKFNVH